MLKQKLYTLEDQCVVVGNDNMLSSQLILRDCDGENFCTDDIKLVFKYAYSELIDKLEKHHDLDSTTTQSKERELMFLLEAVVQARRLLKKTEKD